MKKTYRQSVVNRAQLLKAHQDLIALLCDLNEYLLKIVRESKGSNQFVLESCFFDLLAKIQSKLATT